MFCALTLSAPTRDTLEITARRPSTLSVLQPFSQQLQHKILEAKMVSETDMTDAIQTYEKDPNLTIHDAATQFDVPISTLGHRLRGRQAVDKAHSNQKKLAPELEAKLRDWIFDNDYAGFVPNYDLIAYMASQMSHAKAPMGNH